MATESGAEEILGEAIYSAEPDSDSLSEAIKKALKSEVTATESRTWKEMAEETVEVYRDLI